MARRLGAMEHRPAQYYYVSLGSATDDGRARCSNLWSGTPSIWAPFILANASIASSLLEYSIVERPTSHHANGDTYRDTVNNGLTGDKCERARGKGSRKRV